ncbi:serine/threonine-protein phosphatase 4 regulatory subunit 1-like isoform X2 [Babylonia areolata]|uniref:serine/threonine-protein phosphatase 4 regulatory subunit 1-like isoform X2 n=1 Tax=Babylonia areolata TaxID=304850 RepID=UPI003FD4CB20
MGDSDESLTPLQRLEKYLESDIFNRQMVARTMLDTLRASGDDQETCGAVLDCMARLSHDTEPSVRSELMEQVPHIAVYCQENKSFFTDAMPTYILPMVVRYLNDANNQVRKTSQAALLVLLEQGLVEKEDIEHQVVSVILELASPSSHDDYRTEAVALMSKMAPLLGRDITERLFLPRFCEMLTDPLFHVRKVCASNFGEVCSVVGVQNSEEVLLPKFYNLCGDGVWGVRKACAECFMTISCACSLETRRQYLANLFVDLLADQSRWVRMSAFQQLGPFISTFADPRLTGLYVAEDGSVVLQDTGESIALSGGGDGVDDRVFEERGSPVTESLLSEEMDVVLDCEEDAAGEGLSEGKLVMGAGHDDLSVEERRAGHIQDQCAGGDRKLESSPTEQSDQPSGGPSGESLENQMTSLSVEDKDDPAKSESDPSRTEGELEEWVKGESKAEPAASDDKCDKCTDSDQPESMLSDLDNASVASLASSQTQSSSVPSQICDSDASSVSTTASGNMGDRVHVHLDNSNFNTFQFWRSPLPEVDIDFDVINGAPANIHVVAKVKDEEKHKVYSTHVDVVMSSDSEDASASSFTQISEGALRRDMDLHGVRIHTASVSTVSDTDETVRNIGSTNILGDSMGECTLAVVDGVVKDLSGNSSMGYMDAPHHVDDSVLAQQQDIIPQSLLENYLGMVEPSRAQTVDTEITRHCAYNLPAVAYTLGRQNWHCIKHLYETLSQAMQWKVRRTLAFSIHEMALIEGEEITHRDLLPVFDGFIKDLDEVRIGVLKHLADFLRLLRPGVRQQYLGKLSDFMKTDNHRNWRFRKELAEQLTLLCELFDAHSIIHHICPLAVALAMDKVSEVRTESYVLMSAVLRRVNDDNEDKLLQMICCDLIDQFALSAKWSGRQIFCQLCHGVLRENALPPPVFAELLLPSVLALGRDSIPNVRLAVARVLAQCIIPFDYFTSSQNPCHEELVSVLQALQTDKDRDVRFFSSQQPDTDICTGIPHAYDTVPV